MANSSSQRVPRMYHHYSNGQPGGLAAKLSGFMSYLRDPRRRFFNADCRRLVLERFGLVMRNVPLPRYSA